MIALPVGIISAAFADQVRRREFVVTWGMLARVPLFSDLGAAEIADIMRLLRAQTIETGEILVRRGEPAALDVFHRGRRGRDRAARAEGASVRLPLLRRDRPAAAGPNAAAR